MRSERQKVGKGAKVSIIGIQVHDSYTMKYGKIFILFFILNRIL